MKAWPRLRYTVRPITVLFTFCFIMGCASEEEKRERVENAFDLSGSYRTTSDSEVKMTFDIINENGRNDIILYLKRESPLRQEEIDFLNSHQMSVDFVRDQLAKSMELGKGKGKYENQSDDFGESSSTNVCSALFQQSESRKVRFCFSATTTKKTKRMVGNLGIELTKTDKKIVDGKEQEVVTGAYHYSSFKVNMEAVLYKQYAGRYAGEIYSLVSGFDVKPLSEVRLVIDEPSESYWLEKVSATSVTYAGNTYIYNKNASTGSIAELRDPDYPAVQLVFVGPSTKRLVLFGQIWSLGHFSGSITYIDSGSQTDIGTFRFARR